MSLTIEELIEKAAADLPPDVYLVIEVERGCGSIQVHYADNTTDNDVWDGDTFRDRLEAAIDDALKHDSSADGADDREDPAFGNEQPE